MNQNHQWMDHRPEEKIDGVGGFIAIELWFFKPNEME
jgi:hypothetical protein